MLFPFNETPVTLDLPYSKDNWTIWGYGDEPLGLPTGPFFQVLTAPVEPLRSVREEALATATCIANTTKLPIFVTLSGGYDSQMTCLSFKAINQPFTAVTHVVKARDGSIINHEDVRHAIEFANVHNLPHILVENSLSALIELFTPLAKKHNYPHYRALFRLGAAHHPVVKKGLVINSVGEGVLDLENGELIHRFDPDLHPIAKDLGIALIDRFCKYTPGYFYSRLVHPVNEAFLKSYPVYYEYYAANSKTPYWHWRVWSQFIKPLIIADTFDGLIHHYKRTGYETFKQDAELKAIFEPLEDPRLGRSISISANTLMDLAYGDLVKLRVSS